MTELDTDTRRIVARLAEITAKVTDLNGEAEALKAELRDLGPGDFTDHGATVLRVIANRRLDAMAAAALLDDATRQDCLKVDYDPTKIRQHLTPDQLDACMVTVGKPKVVLA